MTSLEKGRQLLKMLDAKAVLDVDAALALVADGADIQQKNEHGRTLLMLAARRGHEDLCRALVGAGADPRETDALGDCAAHMAPNNTGTWDYLRGLTYICDTQWTATDDNCVVLTRTNYASDFKMTAVFNFETQQKTMTTDCCSGGFESASAPKPFDKVPAAEIAKARSYLKGGF